MWYWRAVTLFKLGTGIGSAAAKDKDCNDQANFSIYDFSFSLPLIRWESSRNQILYSTHFNDITTWGDFIRVIWNRAAARKILIAIR
jgi:hypothetical protein